MTLDISKESCECICGFYLLMSWLLNIAVILSTCS
jgi:hypothetical protein